MRIVPQTPNKLVAEREAMRRPLRVAKCAMALMAGLLAACASRGYRPRPIPVATPPAWVTVFTADGFRISADTQHVEYIAAENGTLIWFLTLHDQVRRVDSLTFNRSRIRLIVRCRPLEFRSVSQELALDEGRPVSHQQWSWSGPNAPAWRVPAAGATDDEFLRRTCALLSKPPSSQFSYSSQ